MTTANIFASPPEPCFGLSELFVTADLLEDALKNLAVKNQQNMTDTTENDGHLKEGRTADLLFSICKKLDLPVEVRYVAVEIFDKFMTKHISELYEIVKNSSSKEKQLDWGAVETRLKDQIPLRAASCIQLASKLVSHYKALTPSKVKRFLSSCGLQYSITSVVRSEMRILKALGFRLTFTSPLTHIELLLEVLRRNCPGMQANWVHGVAIKILDVVYLQKIHIYKLLCESAGSDFDLKLANDFFLLATCVIVAAAYIIDPESNDSFIEQMSLITCIEEADIIMFATVLVKVMLDLTIRS